MAQGVDLDNLLRKAIADADKETLQAVLSSMCESSTECRLAATQKLLVTKNQEAQIDSSGSEADAGAETRPRPRKRKRGLASPGLVSRYATCRACKERFDITTNTKDACRRHDGVLEVDSDQFPDDDDIQAGEYIDVETDWRVEEVPEGFIWDCCAGHADSDPCVIQAHEAIGT